jgi:hypothetical protein
VTVSHSSQKWLARRIPSWRFVSHGGLDIEVTTDPNSAILQEFFTGYDAAFTLPQEKESLAGFKECLKLNTGAVYDGLVNRYGPFREVVLVLRDAGAAVAGANFIAFPLLDVRHGAEVRQVLSMNLNYIYVVPESRSKGHFKRLVAALPEVAHRCFESGSESRALIFLEQHDPAKLDAEDSARDTAQSGLDQHARMRVWARQGTRILDFDYVQPPLSAAQEPARNLMYGLIGASSNDSGADGVQGLSACLLSQHLQRFFSISVLKGVDCRVLPDIDQQLSQLETQCKAGLPVKLLPSGVTPSS